MHPEHFFKYYTADTAIKVLTTQKVRWNSPLNFNDPFDCYFSPEPKFDVSKMAHKKRERLLDLVSQDTEPDFDPQNPYVKYLLTLRQHAKSMSREQAREKLGTILDELGYGNGLENLTSLWREIWKKMMADFRLLCVCESKDNLLLWTHYTNNHTGAVFQFECIAELDVPLLAAQRVVYSDEPPGLATEDEWLDSVLGLRPLNTGEEVNRRLVTTKVRALEHEKEWRVVSGRRHYENQGYEDIKFFPREISKVFFGCRMTDSHKADILSLLSGSFAHTEAYQARQHPKKYQLEFDRIN
jgi:hypothetical protein